ncbi:hypothetical protein [Clostridium estertheticum]|uniref:hypothetical protein n=1 Tax=Clostridium estertheticum TaxID=238834 RepID=UPI001C7DC0DE|nr:hypothetical protein [Clostridium estertheticum]MBX4272070.1 hypothetical protein [Clostridium estertheticum]WLC82434.1 hypothetical protein KTC98_23950 [Clostridium estertheticum]
MEGNQIVLLILKLISQVANRISQIIARAGIEYLKHRQRKRELGLKKGKVLKTDKVELLIAKNIKKTLVVNDKTFEEKIRVSKFKLDCYKLEMQSELAEFEKNIKILTSGIGTAKDQIKKDMIQKELYKTIHQKTEFEKEVNSTLLHKNKEINNFENDYKHIKENIKICDKAIDGFASNRARDMTESIRSDFESLVKEESMAYSKKSFEHDKEFKNDYKDIKEPEVKEKEIIREVKTEINANIVNEAEIEIDRKIDKEIGKEFVNQPEKTLAKTEEEPVKVKTEKIKDDEFTKVYLEKQRRKSLSKENQKDLAMER